MFAALTLIIALIGTTTAEMTSSVQISVSGQIITSNPLRYIDFETGDFSQVGSGSLSYAYSSDIPVITLNNPYAGNYACNVSTAQTRSSSMDSYVILSSIPLGSEIYYDFEMYVPSGYSTGNNWDLLWEWYPHNSVGANHHLGVGIIDANGVSNNLYFHFYGIQFDWNVPEANPGIDNVMIYSGIGLPTGRWVHFQILYNSDDVNGQVEVKMDNAVVLNWQGKTTFNDTSYMQWGFGTYCASTTNPHWFGYDNIWIDTVPHS